MIARSHISFGGNFLILVGGQERWKFKGGTHSYTRKIEDMGKLLIFDTEDDFFAWSDRLKALLMMGAPSFAFTSTCRTRQYYPFGHRLHIDRVLPTRDLASFSLRDEAPIRRTRRICHPFRGPRVRALLPLRATHRMSGIRNNFR